MQYWLLPSADLYLASWKHVFIFISVRVKKHNLKPPVASPPPPPPKKNTKKREKGVKGCKRFHQNNGQISHTHRHPVRCYTRWFAILLQHCFSIATLCCAKNRNLGQIFLDFFNASGKNCASLSILPLSLTGVHTKNGYDVNKKLNSQNSKEHWLYL